MKNEHKVYGGSNNAVKTNCSRESISYNVAPTDISLYLRPRLSSPSPPYKAVLVLYYTHI